jgi:hypothetical protein
MEADQVAAATNLLESVAAEQYYWNLGHIPS